MGLRTRTGDTHPQLLQAEAPAGAHLGVVPDRGASHHRPKRAGRGARGDAARLGLPGLASAQTEAERRSPAAPPVAGRARESRPPSARRERRGRARSGAAHLRILRAGWLNHVATRRCQSLWKWGFRIMPFRLGAMAEADWPGERGERGAS